MTDLETWIHDVGEDKLFNVYVKKFIFTPYEQDKKFSDESVEDLELERVYLKEAIELPNGDVLMGFYWIGDEDGEKSYVYYYKLSEIRLVDVSYEG